MRVNRYGELLRPSLAVALVDFYGALNTTGETTHTLHHPTLSMT